MSNRAERETGFRPGGLSIWVGIQIFRTGGLSLTMISSDAELLW
jgi:hypothetical protein